MAEKSPVKEVAFSESIPISNSNQLKQSPQFSAKLTTPTPPISDIPSTPTSRLPPVDADVIHVPSYSRWFSWDKIDSCESRFLPEFFDGRSSKGPSLYKYYRNSIIKLFRENPSRKITFTEARRNLVGDVGSIRRVFDFLDHWGLINYSASSALSKPSKNTASNNKSSDSPSLESPSTAAPTPKQSSTSRRFCGECKSLCTIACFVCDKYDSTLCARCYVRGNFRVGLSNADFRRVEISDEAKADWSEKETLLLLEAIMHYGDDWKKVAQHVGGRTEKECVAHFVKLPFGEEYLGHPLSDDAESGFDPNKSMRLTPLADASNPIMAQSAFLSALAGVEIAEAAAQAAVNILSKIDDTTASRGGNGSLERNAKQESEISSNGDANQNALERAYADAKSQLDKEEQDIERAITEITEVQMKEIQDKILRFEEMDLLMEKERQQLESMKHLLFIDQLNLSFRKNSN
ncbi:SWI/SNF complex subunit SWI3B [Hibiscus syriacus]|uniref:SWI/SNF complex subunit SWI3B n=1 Tax=Hibiscus syriacus TaxID=106335 RepID=UPI0019222F8F|nr:SWI/SNF complex subunit SWI3B [Hibiscus syriacus]